MKPSEPHRGHHDLGLILTTKPMNKRLYAILDTVTNDFGNIITAVHDAAAIRIFTDCVTGGVSFMTEHATDYSLISWGWIDDELKLVKEIQDDNAADQYRLVITGEQVKASQKPNLNLEK